MPAKSTAPTYRDTIPPQVKEPDYRGSKMPNAPKSDEWHSELALDSAVEEAAERATEPVPDSTLTPKELADFCAQLAGADMLELQEHLRHHGLSIVRAKG